jgi:hypothetical protein
MNDNRVSLQGFHQESIEDQDRFEGGIHQVGVFLSHHEAKSGNTEKDSMGPKVELMLIG